VIALISSASSWTATKGITDILLFDAILRRCSIVGVVVVVGGGSLATLPSGCANLAGSSHSGMERSEIAHHLLVLFLLISVDGLSVLT
jgi:hypothetical protein